MYGKGPLEVDGALEFEAPANVVHRGRRIDRGVYSSGKGPRTDALLFIILVEYFKPPPQGPTAPAGSPHLFTVCTNICHLIKFMFISKPTYNDTYMYITI